MMQQLFFISLGFYAFHILRPEIGTGHLIFTVLTALYLP